MAMGQYPTPRYGTDPWEIFRVFLLRNIIFFPCIKRDGHYKSENWTFPQPQRSSDSGKSPFPLLEGWAARRAVFPTARQLGGSTALATKTGMCNSMSFFGNEVWISAIVKIPKQMSSTGLKWLKAGFIRAIVIKKMKREWSGNWNKGQESGDPSSVPTLQPIHHHPEQVSSSPDPCFFIYSMHQYPLIFVQTFPERCSQARGRSTRK